MQAGAIVGCDEAQVQLRVDEFCRTDPVTATVFKMCPSFLLHSFLRALGHMISTDGLDILPSGQNISVCPLSINDCRCLFFFFFSFPLFDSIYGVSWLYILRAVLFPYSTYLIDDFL